MTRLKWLTELPIRILRTMFRFKLYEPFSGDLEEHFAELRSMEGSIRACLWLWGQVMKSLPGFVKSKIEWSLMMLKNYVKVLFRNFQRQKMYTLINLAGLTAGLMVGLFIFLWVQHELSYDRYHTNASSLYRVVDYRLLPSGDRRYSSPTPPILGAHLKETYPEIIRSATIFHPRSGLGIDDRQFMEAIAFTNADFFDMFTLPFIKGDAEAAFSDLRSIVLTETLAEKIFQEEEPLGRIVRLEGEADLIVTGVVEDLPETTHFLPFTAFAPLQLLDAGGRNTKTWGDHSFDTYIQIDEEADAGAVETKIAGVFKDHIPNSESIIELQPLTQIHLFDLGGGGLITYVYILSGMAGFILLIACINYMNLATARSAQRAMEVGIRKAVGAEQVQIVRQFLGESFLMAILAMLLAVGLVHLFLPGYNQLVGKTLRIQYSLSTMGVLAGVMIVTALVAGSYPAFFLSRFRTVRVLRGGNRSGRSNRFRPILVVFQFVLSIFILIGTLTIYRQVRYIRNRPLGYEPENVLYITMDGQIRQNFEAIKAELIRNPDIITLTRMNVPLDQNESSTTFEIVRWEGKTDEQSHQKLNIMGVDEEFLKTFDARMAEGSFFDINKPGEIRSGIILNEEAVRFMGVEKPLETAVYVQENQLRILGVIEDFNYRSLHHRVEPLVIIYNWATDNIAIRIRAENTPQTLAYIEKSIRGIIPGYTLNYDFLDDLIDENYRAENRTESIALLMTVLAIFIASLGLLGLASFTAEQRTKEIGIRKVLGASVSGVLLLLGKQLYQWVLIANLIAWPLAYFMAREWLKGFAYRIRITPGLFILAGIFSFVVALLTVSIQSIRAAQADPVKSLRYE